MFETRTHSSEWHFPPRYLLADADELSLVRPILNRLYAPFHDVTRPSVKTERSPLTVRLHAANWGPLSMSSLCYSRAIDIEPQDLGDALLITTASHGRVSFRIAGQEVGGNDGSTALAVNADQPVFRYKAHAEVMKLQLRQEHVDAVCWQFLGHKGPLPVRFSVRGLDGSEHRRWLVLMNYLMHSLQASGGSETSDLLARGVEELLILHLLNSLPHNYSTALQRAPRPLAPRECRRACTYMVENLRGPITLTDIAQAVGCSIRSLSRSFGQSMDTTPMRYLRELRLQQVHAELSCSSTTAVTITEIALRWGFAHLGEFNRQYRQRFGESPSQTRTRAPS